MFYLKNLKNNIKRWIWILINENVLPNSICPGNYYVRTKVNKGANYVFSDGSSIENDNYIWIKVEPIKWINFKEKKIYNAQISSVNA